MATTLRTHRINLRLSAKELKQVQRAAKESKLPPTTYARVAVLLLAAPPKARTTVEG